MSPLLYLSRVPEALRVDSEGQVPDAWEKIDVFSQGLVSRYLARERGAPKGFDLASSWVLLHPFRPEQPAFYGIWNSLSPLSDAELGTLSKLSSTCFVDQRSFTPADLKMLLHRWPEFREWKP